MSNITKTISCGALAALLVSPLFLASGCDAPPESVEDEQVAVSEDEEEFRSWTGYTSEEYPPLECGVGEAVQGAHCTGGYCDNIALYCTYTGKSTGWSAWQSYISEEGEGSADEAHCADNDMWMTGISCTGGYCDNISIRCTQLIGSSPGACWWSGWYSEEQPPFFASWGTFVKGVECDGGYCDNKRYHYCWMY